MKVNRVKKASLLAVAVVAGISSFACADTPLTGFTPGDLAVIRTGDATTPDTTAITSQVPVYIDEYTVTGSYVGTLAVPQTGANALTLPGSGDDQHQGLLNVSTNGNFLSFAGYNVNAGTADANSNASIGKVVGLVSLPGVSVDTTTVVNSYGAGSSSPYIRGAFTNDGKEFWTFGKYAASGATSNGGLAYVSGTGPTATTTTVEGFADWRDIIAVNGQLYGGTGSSSVGNHGPYQIGTGEPTTNLGTSLAVNMQLGNYSGGQSASALALVDLPGNPNSQNGVNTLYTIGDQSGAGITKYSYQGSTLGWVNEGSQVSLNANDAVDPTGLVADVDPSNPNFVDLAVSGTNGIYTYIDNTGPTGTIAANAFTEVVSAPTGEQFRGLAAVPEPASLSLLGLGACSLLGRRNRRKA
jgi:hypothetical protein